MSEELSARRTAMEDAFFSRSEGELLEDLDSAIEQGERNQRMIDQFGIAEPSVVERLAALGLGERTLAAVSLVPLVQVAWADGKLQAKERAALLSAAERSGLKEWSVAYRLFKEWLDQPPSPELVRTWKDYVRALVADQDPEHRRFMKQEFLGRAERIAAAAGGILKIGSVSPPEQRVLDDLAGVFDGDS